MGGRGAKLVASSTKAMIKPEGMRQEAFDRYIDDGFDQQGINRIWEETKAMREQIKKNAERREREGERHITSTTYERAWRRAGRDAEGWLTGGRGRGK